MDIYLTYIQHDEEGAILSLDTETGKRVWMHDDWDPIDNPL